MIILQLLIAKVKIKIIITIRKITAIPRKEFIYPLAVTGKNVRLATEQKKLPRNLVIMMRIGRFQTNAMYIQSQTLKICLILLFLGNGMTLLIKVKQIAANVKTTIQQKLSKQLLRKYGLTPLRMNRGCIARTSFLSIVV